MHTCILKPSTICSIALNKTFPLIGMSVQLQHRCNGTTNVEAEATTGRPTASPDPNAKWSTTSTARSAPHQPALLVPLLHASRPNAIVPQVLPCAVDFPHVLHAYRHQISGGQANRAHTPAPPWQQPSFQHIGHSCFK